MMNYIKSISFIICLFISFLAKAQQPVKLMLDKQANDDMTRKMQSLIALYKYPKQPFAPYSVFGTSAQGNSEFNVKMPDLTGYKDTCFGFIFFGGADNEKLKGNVFTLVVQNKRDMKPAIIWTDKNFNLDLTDDGNPDTMKYDQPFLDITFYDKQNKSAYYTCRLSRLDLFKNAKYKMLVDDYYKGHSGNKIFAGSVYSFKEQRQNIRAADYKVGNDSFRIALKDVNCNGYYAEPGIDLILIGNYGQEELGDANFQIDNKNTFFEKNAMRFDVKEIDATGKSLTVELNTGAKLTRQLNTGKKIPKFKFSLIEDENKKIKIKKYKNKPTYIYFWNYEQTRFTEDTIALRSLQNEFGSKINILTLNYGETPKELLNFKQRASIPWAIGRSSKPINDLFYVETFPSGFFTKKRLKLTHANISPAELLTLLRNGSGNKN
ncbi:MAG: redoxin domain-containing protein [Bacteroidia bacterium]|nr:redoxin domain-containing protein [Bacteroidia bacterium]